MTEKPFKDDFRADWPAEVKEAYDHLKVPSLYEALLANEKMSLEIRRQNKEVRELTESFQMFSSQVNSLMEELLEDLEDEEGEEGEVFIQSEPRHEPEEPSYRELTDLEQELLQDKMDQDHKQMRAALIEASDAIMELSKTTRQMVKHLLSIIPHKQGLFYDTSKWRPITEELLLLMQEQTETACSHVLMRLSDTKIQVIDPQPGESFVPHKHRVVEQISGGQPGLIAHSIRVGYLENNAVLRLADVAIYV